MHFFNTPPGLTEDQLIGIFNIKDVPATSVRLFPLKTERSSSGLIEFSNISQAVLAIMKCNHLPIEGKGEIVLCLSVIKKKVKSMWPPFRKPKKKEKVTQNSHSLSFSLKSFASHAPISRQHNFFAHPKTRSQKFRQLFCMAFRLVLLCSSPTSISHPQCHPSTQNGKTNTIHQPPMQTLTFRVSLRCFLGNKLFSNIAACDENFNLVIKINNFSLQLFINGSHQPPTQPVGRISLTISLRTRGSVTNGLTTDIKFSHKYFTNSRSPQKQITIPQTLAFYEHVYMGNIHLKSRIFSIALAQAEK